MIHTAWSGKKTHKPCSVYCHHNRVVWSLGNFQIGVHSDHVFSSTNSSSKEEQQYRKFSCESVLHLIYILEVHKYYKKKEERTSAIFTVNLNNSKLRCGPQPVLWRLRVLYLESQLSSTVKKSQSVWPCIMHQSFTGQNSILTWKGKGSERQKHSGLSLHNSKEYNAARKVAQWVMHVARLQYRHAQNNTTTLWRWNSKDDRT